MASLTLKTRLHYLSSLLLFSLFALSGCERKSIEEAKPATPAPEKTSPGKINLQETRLAVIPEEYDTWSNISFSNDGKQAFYQARIRNKAFIITASTGGETRSPAYEGVSFFIKSPDGRRFAFGGLTGRKKRLVVDNGELSELSHEEVAPALFSPDSRYVVCEVGGLNEKKWFVVVLDGKKEIYRSPVYPDTWRQPLFSPDGRLLVYELGDDKTKIGNKKSILFFLDVSARKIIKERLYAGYRTGSLSFSSDASRVIYSLHRDGKNLLVLQDLAENEERQVEIPYASAVKFTLSPDGKHIISNATKEKKQYLVISTWKSPTRGNIIGPYEAIVSPVFIPGAKTLTYHIIVEGKWRRVVGGTESVKYDEIGEATIISPDGSKVAYPAIRDSGKVNRERRRMMDGDWIMVVSPVEKPDVVKEGPVYDMVVTPVWSPDGRRIAYRARMGSMENARRFIVVADAETGKVIKEGPAGDEIWPPVWSADGKAVGYGARLGRELWWRVEKLP